MKHAVKGYAVTVVIAAIMAAVMLVFSPLQTLAVGEQVLGRYISELIIVTNDQVEAAKGAGYTVVEEPLYDSRYKKDIKAGAGSTYIAFKTTNNAEDAITDIRAMNMNGGWSFAEYENYQKEMRSNAEKMAAELWDAIIEYRTLYNNEATRTENVKYAYDLLNVLYDDDILDDAGKPMKMGDLLANPDIIKNSSDEKYVTIFMESNMDALQMIYTALANACSKTGGKTFLQKLNDDPFTYTDDYADNHSVDSYIGKLKSSFDKAREYIDFYSEIAEEKQFSSNAEAEEYIKSLPESGSSSIDEMLYISKGYLLTKELQNVEYYGIEGEFDTLYDFFTVDEDKYKDDEYMMPNLRAIVSAMSEGMRRVATIGITEMIAICATEDGRYYDALNGLKDNEDYSDVFENGISIFTGVDREIFEEHAVAMTSAAIRGNANGDTSWQQADAKAEKLTSVAYICGIVSGITCFFAVVAILAAVDGAYSFGDFLVNFGQILMGTMVGIDGGFSVLFAIMSWGIVVSVLALIAMIVLFVLSSKAEPVHYDDYVEIPGMLCDYSEKIDPETGEKIKDSEEYIYYKGVVNPFGVRTVAAFAEDGEEGQKLPENKKGVMDIYNWELRGYRQWLALYTTKDRRAGFPIMSGETFTVTDDNTSGLFAAYFGNEKTKACDMIEILNHSYNSVDRTGVASHVYLRYTVDPDAVYPDNKEQDVMRTLIGSAVSNGASWGMGVIGLGLGCLGGILIGKHSKKKISA